MRRLLLLILCLSTMWTAQGQVAYDWRYWFDQSPTYEQGSSEGTLHLDVDVSGLNKTLHQIYIQVRDTAGVFSEPVSKYFVISDDGHGSSKLHYWFDQNNADLHVADLGNGMFDLDVSLLNSGFHTLHFIATDKYGATSEPMHRGFIRATDGKSLKWRYWFDDALDKSVVMPPTTTSLMIDVDSLSDGIHYIHLQAMNETFSEAKTQMFIKVPKTVDLDEMYCLVLIDNMLHSKETINMKNGGMATLNLDVKDLSQGLHKLDVMVMTPSGALSTAYNSYFIRGYLGDDRGALRCMYAFDDEADVHETTYSEGMSHLNIDVAHLTDGPHIVRWMLADREGAYVSDKRSWFIKLPLGGNTVSKYCYWLNDADSVKHVKVLEEPKNPYDLIALLPVESMPLRSSCFHFENKDNQPMMYAKNDIHFTFTDRFDRETNISKQYVDYNVSEAVTEIEDLKYTQTFARVEENCIKWFKFEALEGDTIIFRANQATTIQVFDPAGKEIYSASGDQSVKYGGAHTWEDGTHYVAVHDVTGSKPNVTLDYMHMDKYDVVSQDVHVVGNGGCSTITFQGNGFRDLYKVDLYTAQGDTIHSIDVGHESDATTTVTFDFTGAELGKYNALFRFADDDKTVTNCVTVEEAKEIELTLRVDYPSTFLRGNEVTFSVTIENIGNSTAYEVPVDLFLQSGKYFANIEYATILVENKNIGKFSLCDRLDMDSVSNETLSMLDEQLQKIQGCMNFFVVKDNNDNEEGVSYLDVTIPGNSKKCIYVTVKSLEQVSLNVRIPSKWICLNSKQQSEPRSRLAKSSSNGGGLCCYKERTQCTVEVVCDLVGMIPVAGCVSSLVDLGTYTFTEYACTGGGNMQEKMQNFKNSLSASTLGGKIFGGALSCFAGVIGKLIDKLKDQLKGLFAARREIDNLINIQIDAKRFYLDKYESLMREADDYYKAGNIAKAEELEQLAKTAKADAAKAESEAERLFSKKDGIDEEIRGLERQIDEENERYSNIINGLKNLTSAAVTAFKNNGCVKSWTDPAPNCPPNPNHGGGSSTPRNSCEPNDIRGYTSESGSTFMRDDVDEVTYIIDSENDPVFADAPAHTVIITDTINGKYYDLESLSTRNVTIGDVSMDLDGTEQNFIKTMDLRPRINVIAQVEQKYDPKTGIAKWIWTSLDPMTMEPTTEVMQGVLPVNDETHIGEGHITYQLKQKTGLPDGTEVTNQADIIFDSNDPVYTPIWTNIIDAVPPTSHVSGLEMLTNDSVRVHFEGTDERSGVWKYILYTQYGEGSSWEKVAEVDTTCADFKFFPDLDYGFCVLATDSAGNVEPKELVREYGLQSYQMGDANSDGKVDMKDAILILNYYVGIAGTYLNVKAADANSDGLVDVKDAIWVADHYVHDAQQQRSLKALIKRTKIRVL